ncbi:Zn-ribbon domain-containing OB-fold protein [Aneurinibacillus terranovensis]|uniref:Zn-ribbon domain-containing OB-fold protein n=1 Tax=Aneurinibacillus terranovensis TaxID=278991 RepID=UPI000405F1B3|nr:OB-fold domain-containing protein [Aneurinibacillus terranovensis]
MAKKLKAYQCRECGRQALISPGYCPNCRSNNSYTSVDVEGKGKIFSYTTVHICEERLQSEVPYLLAVIESENGLRLIGRLSKPWRKPVIIGNQVELIDVKDGTNIFMQIVD